MRISPDSGLRNVSGQARRNHKGRWLHAWLFCDLREELIICTE